MEGEDSERPISVFLVHLAVACDEMDSCIDGGVEVGADWTDAELLIGECIVGEML